MASGLSARLRRLESCVLMLGEMRGRLEYIQPTVQSLIGMLAGQRRFEGLGFLQECAGSMLEGKAFSSGWREALEKWSTSLGREEAAILASLGDVLGRSDLESQLSALALAQEQLEQRIAGTRDRVQKQGNLYRSMGVLGGVAAAIILM